MTGSAAAAHVPPQNDEDQPLYVEDVAGGRRLDTFAEIPLLQLIESGHNPRRHFDAVKLQELAESIQEKGIVEPLVVREIELGHDLPSFEVVAGARRLRAAGIAGLSTVPCVIRAYTDEDVLELVLIENVQRDDLAPLEQARGFKQLLEANPDKYSAATIATKVGMSPAWVWDRLKLLDLVPEARLLLEQGRITTGHAILLARLKPADQARAITVRGGSIHDRPGGLWTDGDADGVLFVDEASAERDPYRGLKPVTVRELEEWINSHVRFDVEHAAKAVPLQFADVAHRVEEAKAQPGRGRKVIAITFEHFTQPDARTEDERTFGPSSFKFADGAEHTDTYPKRTYTAKTCEYSVLGVVAAGERRGEAFDVCIARTNCQVHWQKEIAEKAKTAKLLESGKTKQANTREAKEREQRNRQAAKEQAAKEAWDAFYPKLRKSATEAAARVPAVLSKGLFSLLLKRHRLPPKTTPAQFQKALLLAAVRSEFRDYQWHGNKAELVTFATLLGVDVKTLEPKTEHEQRIQETPAQRKAAKRR